MFTWSRRCIWEDVLSSINMTGEFPGHQGIPITLTHIGQDPGSKRFKEERCLKSEIVGWRTGPSTAPGVCSPGSALKLYLAQASIDLERTENVNNPKLIPEPLNRKGSSETDLGFKLKTLRLKAIL